jgi:hypothetical protein
VRDTESYRTCFPAGRRAFGYWRRIFDRVYQGDIDTWDYQWAFACWIQRGLSIVPEVNLVSNIGFGPNATHTTYNRWFAQLPIHSIDFPLRHPPFVIRNGHHDAFTQTVVLGTGGYVPRAIHKLARTLRRVRI